MFNKILILAMAMATFSWAQPSVPFGIGASLALGQDNDHPFISDLEIEPYLQIWILQFGLARIGYNSWSISHSLGDDQYTREFSTLSVEALVNLNPALQNPYLSLGWRRKQAFDDSPIGDAEWQEWSVGLGGNWLVQPGVYLYSQVDYRFSDDLFQDPADVDKIYMDYSVWKWIFGITVYVL